MNQFLLYVLGVMIFYDLCIHLIYLFRKEDIFIKRKINFWPNFGKGDKFNRNHYQIFWTIYWLTAFSIVLFLIYNN